MNPKKLKITKSLYELKIKASALRLRTKILQAKTKKELDALLVTKKFFFAKLRETPDIYEKYRILDYELTEIIVFGLTGVRINLD